MKAIKYAEKKNWCEQIKDEEGQKLCKGIRVGCSILTQLTGVDTDLCTEIALKGIPCDINKFSELSNCDSKQWIENLKKEIKTPAEALEKAQWGMYQWLKSLETR